MFHKVFPQHSKYPPGTMHGYYNIVDHIPYALLYIPHGDYSVTTRLYFLVSSPPLPVPAAPSPLPATSPLSVSVSLFQFCLLNYFVV